MAVIWFLLALVYSVEIFSFWYEHVAKSSVFVGIKSRAVKLYPRKCSMLICNFARE